MSTHDAQICLLSAGLLHFCQIPAMAFFSRHVLRLTPELSLLMPVNRKVIHVLAIAIVLTVVGLGLVVVLSAAEIAQRSRLGCALCVFLAVFWSFRAAAQLWYAPDWPHGLTARAMHWGLLALFSSQAALYAAVALWR